MLGLFRLATASAFFLLPLATLHAQEEPAAPPSTIAVEDVRPDEKIAERLRAVLDALGREGIGVGVEASVIHLTGEVAEEADSAEIAAIAERIDGVVAVRNDLEVAAEISEQLNPAIKRFTARIEQAVARLPLLLLALAIFVMIVGLGFLLARARLWDRLAPNAFIAGIYRQAVRVVIGIAGVVVALDVAGASALLGTILGAAGLVGLAIGFAVRDTVENFVASIMLSLRQPFQPNDLVEIEGDTGRVIRLTSRATILLSLDGNHIRIPNFVVFKSRIINYTRNPERRFSFDIGIDPDADLESTRLLAQKTLAGLPFVLPQPEPLVWIEDVREAGAILRSGAWIDQNVTGFATARGDAIRLVKGAIEAAGVSIPDTTYRIRLEGLPAGQSSQPEVLAERPTSASRSEPAPAAFRESEEKALISMVEAEREGEDDLLRKDAPQE
ncbi:mechanosensitive ion channel domain-containing protein [Limimaricola pyoseonensis]|uniref:Small-conductance mechanosensitive channel n=1 Tax=Limimaricola pyoseonensis TaxID=521013 RepID=A0A1G7K4P3_9RHOB|nr:mechanosensitive ion channel domain-containing protein [Limimaricola pyoseonensis]SDF31749.1 Small-conductance mechanosensitive channel [Limimaricola pyoseonensis]